MPRKTRFLKRLAHAIPRLVQRRGFAYFGYLLSGYVWPKLGRELLERLSEWGVRRVLKGASAVAATLIFAAVSVVWGPDTALLVLLIVTPISVVLYFGGKRLRIERMVRKARALTAGRIVRDVVACTSWSRWEVPPETREAVEEARKSGEDQEIVIGRFDNDGRVLGVLGPLPGLPMVDEADFAERVRFGLDIVLLGNSVLVRKDFRGDRAAFLNEWLSLAILSGEANVPSIHRADETSCRLYRNLVLGKTVREILVKAGARILHAQTRDDPELAHLDAASRLHAVVARGTDRIPECLPEAFLCAMEDQLDRIHQRGVTGVSHTFGNVVASPRDGSPWFIDLEGTRVHRSASGVLFSFFRDQDRTKFSKRYGRSVVTEASARGMIRELASRVPNWYSPIDFGGGLTIGGFWSTDSGTGRWEFLNRRVVAPLVVGKRVLDLGSNNGLMPMMMLRAGAKEVAGIEISPELLEVVETMKQIFEWRDMRRYPLKIRRDDMLEILTADWGQFDVVTAFCSLYYLDGGDIAKVVRKASELAPVMVVQANTATRPEAAAAKAEKSSVPFLEKALRENGFPDVEVFWPKGYTRPILVGKRKQGDSQQSRGDADEACCGLS